MMLVYDFSLIMTTLFFVLTLFTILIVLLYKRFTNKTFYLKNEKFLILVRNGNVNKSIFLDRSYDRIVGGDGSFYLT